MHALLCNRLHNNHRSRHSSESDAAKAWRRCEPDIPSVGVIYREYS